MDKNERERLRALCEKATPPPWRTSMTGYSIKSGPEDPRIIAECPGGTKADTEAFERWMDNAEFIAAARTALPAALDEIERLNKVLVGYWSRFGAIPEDDAGQRMMWRLSALEAVADAAKELHEDTEERGRYRHWKSLGDALVAVAAQKAAK